MVDLPMVILVVYWHSQASFPHNKFSFSVALLFRMNEGFASLFEKIIVDSINGDMIQWTQFVTTIKDDMMLADVNGALVPLNQYVESPAEINDKAYDVTVTHYKGAFLLFMMYLGLQPTTFQKGVRYYLDDRAYQSATPSDLHAGLQRAYDEDYPASGVDIDAIMWPWENLHGYPIVTVSIEGDTLTFAQKGFRTTHDELYGIRIVFTTASTANFDFPVDHTFWLSTRETDISLNNLTIDWTEGDWIVANVRNYGYYVTNYDDTLWNLIIEALTDDDEHTRVHYENRGLLFADFHVFIEQAYDVSSTIFLRLAQSLRIENEITVWNRAHRGLFRITNRLRATDLLDDHLNHLSELFSPIHDRMLDDESFNAQVADHVRFWSCTSRIRECLNNALDELVDAMDGPLLESSLCTGFMTANATVRTHFWNVALESVDDQLLSDLACSSDLAFLSIYLNASLDLTNNLGVGNRRTIINRVFEANFVGFDLIHEFFSDNHEFIHAE